MSSNSKKSVLITGCSDGGLGAALAVAFHEAGLHVYATARNPDKMKNLQAKGIETLTLDLMDDSSITAAVKKISRLDILVNNAGATYMIPFSDASIKEAKNLFDLNVWSYVAVTQAFLPLLVESKGTILNNTSVAGAVVVPFQSIYNASKAAISMISAHQRVELAAFGVKVVDLKTGAVKSNIFQNMDNDKDRGTKVAKGSLYEPAREDVETVLRGDKVAGAAVLASKWAEGVVSQVLKTSPPHNVWAGATALLCRFLAMLPTWLSDALTKNAFGVDKVEKTLSKS
ncbi:hypothetical protein M409DRAFT_23845 [Zasmidium cellare ATCC 36951]|uniref:Uncharacterized protein n=1 Tax=Zasmidium cellare ATCC 36951 TaxID=1080233 RepID=A0A6A6CFU8_ZASCE|nr:uncharacterized protein M409DRAFT_23845 [Zasmidium cellare ATCC 36951]KAF2166117.1 hypothetical protein M409DRAFT_23845 [Zasmidium cellare ATCC 36951]